jgi:hypothetical protein
MLETSLLALFRLSFPEEYLPEVLEIDVALVAVDSEPESRELEVVVGVPVYVVDEAEVRFGVKLDRALAVPDFFVFFSGPEEFVDGSSPFALPPKSTASGVNSEEMDPRGGRWP